MEVIDVHSILQTTFPALSSISITTETPFQERKTALQTFQQQKHDVLIATPGIIGRGLELRQARSVCSIIQSFIIYHLSLVIYHSIYH